MITTEAIPTYWLSITISILILLCGLTPGLDLDINESPKLTFQEVKPFLARYCLKCHYSAKPNTGIFAVNLYSDSKLLLDNKPQWSLASDYLGSAFMPPRGSNQPTAQERKAVSQWIKDYLSGKVHG